MICSFGTCREHGALEPLKTSTLVLVSSEPKPGVRDTSRAFVRGEDGLRRHHFNRTHATALVAYAAHRRLIISDAPRRRTGAGGVPDAPRPHAGAVICGHVSDVPAGPSWGGVARRSCALLRGMPACEPGYGSDMATIVLRVRPVGGEHTDLTYEDPDQVDENEMVKQVIEALRQE